MIVRVHSACWWQLLRAMGMLSIYMIWMIVSKPAIFGVIVSNQQAFAMMPAITEDIIVLLAFGGLLIFAQAIPLAMWMLLKTFSQLGYGNHTITSSLEEETEIDVHQTIKTEFFVNPADF